MYKIQMVPPLNCLGPIVNAIFSLEGNWWSATSPLLRPKRHHPRRTIAVEDVLPSGTLLAVATRAPARAPPRTCPRFRLAIPPTPFRRTLPFTIGTVQTINAAVRAHRAGRPACTPLAAQDAQFRRRRHHNPSLACHPVVTAIRAAQPSKGIGAYGMPIRAHQHATRSPIPF
jgi:hypothetical protein